MVALRYTDLADLSVAVVQELDKLTGASAIVYHRRLRAWQTSSNSVGILKYTGVSVRSHMSRSLAAERKERKRQDSQEARMIETDSRRRSCHTLISLCSLHFLVSMVY